MQSKYDLSWDYLENLFSKKLPAEKAWEKFIRFQENIVSKNYWESIKKIDVTTEKTELTNLFHHLMKSSPLEDNVTALWIGIIRLEYNDKDTPVIYITGSDSYNPDNIDWACSCIYQPDNRYFILDGLIEIDNEIKTDENDFEFLDWILPLSYCTFLLDDIFRNDIDLKLLPENKIYITVGYDSGDYIHLTPIDNKKGDSL